MFWILPKFTIKWLYSPQQLICNQLKIYDFMAYSIERSNKKWQIYNQFLVPCWSTLEYGSVLEENANK